MGKPHRNNIKIYFSAPSPANEEQRKLFVLVRDALVTLKYKLTYDWLEDTVKLSPKELYRKAKDAIYLADVVIAEVTYPSTGVGQQIGMANDRKIPVLAIYNSQIKPAGRFTLGSENDLLKVSGYTVNNLKTVLQEKLEDIGKKRFVKFNFISTPEINGELEKESERIGVSKSELLRKILSDWIVSKK